MSIFPEYIRLSDVELNRIRQDINQLEIIKHKTDTKTESINLDKFYSTLSWLLSARKRVEQECEQEIEPYLNSLIKESKNPIRSEYITGKIRELNDKHKAMLANFKDKTDIFVDFIEGRMEDNLRDKCIVNEYGPAAVFNHDAMININHSFSMVLKRDLKKSFNPKLMLKMNVEPMIWDEHGFFNNLFDQCVYPKFLQLQEFVRKSAEQQNYVIVRYI